MYAYTREAWRGFFEGVCTPSNATAHLDDPPPPHNAREPEPRQWGSGSMRFTSHPSAYGPLA